MTFKVWVAGVCAFLLSRRHTARAEFAMSDTTLVTNADARRLLGNVSHMFIYRRLKDDLTFPKPIRYAENGPMFFRKAEILDWIESHREAA